MAKASEKVLLGFVDEPITENCLNDVDLINKIGELPVSSNCSVII
jgi:hypothetical protein